MSASIMVLYPNPTDVEKFEQDYLEHLHVFAENLPDAPAPKVTRIKQNPSMPTPYHMIVTVPFESMDALKETMSSPGMQTVGGHANQISSGGAPVILVGVEN